MVWYKRKIVAVPMVVVALVFCIAVPMAVTSNKRKSDSASPSSPRDEDPPIDKYPNDAPEDQVTNRDTVKFDESQTNPDDVKYDETI